MEQYAHRVSERAKEIIRKHEGLKLNAYICPTGHLSIGYGHTRGVKPGMVITPARAEELLEEDLAEISDTLFSHFPELNQCQFDAVASFVYNMGWAKFRISPMYRRLSAGKHQEFADKLPQWNKGVVAGVLVALPGLTKRRNEEKALFVESPCLSKDIPIAKV